VVTSFSTDSLLPVPCVDVEEVHAVAPVPDELTRTVKLPWQVGLLHDRATMEACRPSTRKVRNLSP
jgi:hypothetical protein